MSFLRTHSPLKRSADRRCSNRYCQWFRSGAFGQAIARLPMFNQLDDHDLIDGFGSYPEALQTSAVFSSIGSTGYKWYLLFQSPFSFTFSSPSVLNLRLASFPPVFIVDEVDGTLADERGISPNNPSKCLILGGDGPYIPFRNHSYITPLGPKQALVAIDWRCERKFDQVRSIRALHLSCSC